MSERALPAFLASLASLRASLSLWFFGCGHAAVLK